jgi:hypothetical protein
MPASPSESFHTEGVSDAAKCDRNIAKENSLRNQLRKTAIRHLKPELMLVNFCKGCEKRCIHAASCTHRSIVLSKAWARSTEASDSKRNLTPDGGFNQL